MAQCSQEAVTVYAPRAALILKSSLLNLMMNLQLIKYTVVAVVWSQFCQNIYPRSEDLAQAEIDAAIFSTNFPRVPRNVRSQAAQAAFYYPGGEVPKSV